MYKNWNSFLIPLKFELSKSYVYISLPTIINDFLFFSGSN